MLICCSRNNTCSIYCVASYFCLFGLLFSNTTWTWKYMCPVRTRCVKEAKKSLILLLFSSIIADSVLWSGCDVRDRDICSDWLLDRQILWPAGGLGKQKRLLQTGEAPDNIWLSSVLVQYDSSLFVFLFLSIYVFEFNGFLKTVTVPSIWIGVLSLTWEIISSMFKWVMWVMCDLLAQYVH